VADLTAADAARLAAEATPGPWYVVYTDDDSHMNSTYVGTVDRGAGHDNQVGMDGSRIAEIVAVTLVRDPCIDAMICNAALIAAAPDLARAVVRLEEERDRLAQDLAVEQAAYGSLRSLVRELLRVGTALDQERFGQVCGQLAEMVGAASLHSDGPEPVAVREAADLETRATADRAAIVAWLRRPVDKDEARGWLERWMLPTDGLERRFNGGDECWTAGGQGIVAYSAAISEERRGLAAAIDRGEHMPGKGKDEASNG
jgi:hypothetical protein